MNLDLFSNASFCKAEPLGIPYMGSKRKHATDLINRMLELQPNARYFYDICGGGGAMSFAAMQKGLKVFYNDKQTCLVNFMQFIFDCIKEPQSRFGIFPADYYNFITREKFIELKHQEGNYAQFARICYSFGNNQRAYLFRKDIEKQKHLAHDIVMFQCEQSLKEFNSMNGTKLDFSTAKDWNSRRLDFRKYIFNFHNKSKKGDIEGQLPQLEGLRGLQQLEPNIIFSNLDYKDIKIETPINESIIYIDPPYRGTAKYIEGVNHDELDTWFGNLPYTAFMSEYNAPFQCIYEKKTISSFSAKATVPRIEKLYVNRRNN